MVPAPAAVGAARRPWENIPGQSALRRGTMAFVVRMPGAGHPQLYLLTLC
jgi:hypothetical protein